MDGRPSRMEMSRITAATETRSRGKLAVRMGIMVALVVLVAAGVVGYKTLGAAKRQQGMRSQVVAAQTVSAEPAPVQEWAPEVAAIGSLKAVSGADLSFEVAGIVDEITFNSGDDVAAGTVLMRLRAQDDVARLASLQAMAQLAAVTFERNMQLSKSQNVSQATLDTNEANLKSARAQVSQQQAILDKKILRAPFAGHLGLRNVDKGQYVNAGVNVVTLQALDPIYLDFFMPQQDLNRIKSGQEIAAKVDTYPDLAFDGQITAINPKVDLTNRNVLVRATLKNPDRKLFPGMYATVKVGAGESKRHVTLPQTAVIYSPYGDAVYILDKKGEQYVARYTFVTLGETRGDLVAVLEGVKEGDMVVTAGAIKLRNGAPARIDNSVHPTSDVDPKPAIP
jgi:membrane fusion protein (multidrug efflux system)